MRMMKKIIPLLYCLFFFFISFQVHSKCRAVLINGGGAPSDNYNVHTAQLREMYNALRAKGCREEDIHVFSASGSADSTDFRVDPTHPLSDYVANPYRFNGSSRVPNLYPADANTLRTKMGEVMSGFKPEDNVFIFVADHGTNDGGRKGLVPWMPGGAGDIFTPEDMERVMKKAPVQTQIKLWTECCFCGAFNRISRPNTCVATSTDEYHVGSYNWNNWRGYANSEMAPGKLTSQAYFAGQVKNSSQVSLAKASNVSIQHTQDDAVFQAETIARGCFVGPRTSLEQYMFGAIGFGNRQLCMNDLLKLAQTQTPRSPNDLCDNENVFSELGTIRNYLNVMQQSNTQLSFSDKRRIERFNLRLNEYINQIKKTNEYKRINDLTRSFNAMSNSDKIKNANWMQREVSIAKQKLMKESNFFQTLLGDQRIIIESLFFARATEPQKAEYRRRKQCLEEPLVN